MKMKAIILFIFLLVNLSINSQVLSDRKVNKINKFEINTSVLNLNDISIQNDLNHILKLNRKRKKNMVFGTMFSFFSASTLTGGVALISQNNIISRVVGVAVTTVGLVFGVASAPFWGTMDKRKKERDKLIKKYQY